jgi:hypothetical protein
MPESFIQVPPNSTGSKVRTRSRVIGANTVHEQAVYQAALPTYYALADAVTCAQNKQVISILNDTGSGKVVALKKLFIINTQLSTVTGVAIRSDVKLATAHSGGSTITPVAADSTNPAIPAQITVRSAATSVTESTLLFPLTYTNDELGATQAFPTAQLMAGLNWFPEGAEVQEVRLREGEGLTIKQITNSSVGQFAWLIVFTIDDA